MTCFKPLRVATDEDGQLDWSIPATSDAADQPVLVPCRHCIGCRMDQARDWSIRCFHEATLHTDLWRDPTDGVTTEIPHNCMVTLTYDDEHLPDQGLLDRQALTGFLRRLNHRRGLAVRQFSAGEYGGETLRPHFHVLLFGEVFPDRYAVQTADGQELSCSHELDSLWGRGRATVDDFSYATARYVSGYVAKKSHDDLTGPLDWHTDEHTGEMRIFSLSPEFRTMSRQPGLGARWIAKHYERVYPDDHVVIGGQELPPPQFYDRWLRKNRPDLYVDVQAARLDGRRQAQRDWTPQRLDAAHTIRTQHTRGDHL